MENLKYRKQLKQRAFALLKEKPAKWPDLPQDASEPQTGKNGPPKDSNAMRPVAQWHNGHQDGITQQEEDGFWLMVRRLGAYQAKLNLRDRAFVVAHPKLGSATSWRVLKLLAEVTGFNFGKWHAQLKEQCEALERAGVSWETTARELPSNGQTQIVECQELFLWLEDWRNQKSIPLNQFTRFYKAYTGDAATWIRIRQGKWKLLNVERRVLLLRSLVTILKAA